MEALEGIADPDHDIDGAGEVGLKVRRSPPRRHLDPQMWRDPHDLFHQPRHQELDREVRHHQAELPVAAGGIEGVGQKQATNLVERLRQRRAQAERASRQLHARAVAHQ
jgi:hypothetical protein